MNLQSVSLSALEASAANPRRKFDRKAIEGLAASIRNDGLLHNLVVKPVRRCRHWSDRTAARGRSVPAIRRSGSNFLP